MVGRNWRDQRKEQVDRIREAVRSEGPAEAVRNRVKAAMGRCESWWQDLHTSDEQEVRVVFNQKGTINDACRSLRLTMVGPSLVLCRCPRGATLMTRDERKGYW